MAVRSDDLRNASIGERGTAPAFALECMRALNFCVVMFLSILMCVSVYGTIHDNSASSFLDGFASIPPAPWKLPLIMLGIYIALMLLIDIKKRNLAEMCVCTAAELALSLWICVLCNFGYTGVLLLCCAEFVRNVKWKKYAAVIISVLFIAYLAADYNLLSGFLNLNSYGAYISYYNAHSRGILLGAVNVFEGINNLLFISFMILLVRGQNLENERIRDMNDRLNSMNTELNEVNAQLSDANVRLEENAKTIAEMTQIEERNRLAREIHDTLGHALTGIVTGLEACMELILIAPEAVKNQLESIADVARQGMTDVRRSVKALRPDTLEKMKLDAAVESMIERISTSTKVKINYDCDVDLSRFSGDEEEIIYRIFQESITNAMRHGKATEIDISVKQHGGMLTIKISDNGIGCDNIKSGFGLYHMRERLEMLRGTLECDGSDGFTVTAHMPVRWE